MNNLGGDRIAHLVAMAVAVLAAIGAVLVDGDIETTLVMLTAVIAGLICFDTCMDRRLRSFAPWLLLSLAPALKTVPLVWAELRSETGLLVERYDHAGSLLFGVCMLATVVLLARPADDLGSSTLGFDSAVILGSSVTGALAGTSVAFLFDSGFGSATVGRLLETPTWFVLSGILAAATIAASHARAVSFGLAGIVATACGTSAVLAVSVAGREVDAGWWAMIFAALAVSAVGTNGALGERVDRDRPSEVAVVIALVVGLVAAAASITARSDRTAWAPGWALLGLISVVMFALAVASKPLDKEGSDTSRPQDIGVDADERASRARARALATLQSDTPIDATSSATLAPPVSADQKVVPTSDDAVIAQPTGPKPSVTSRSNTSVRSQRDRNAAGSLPESARAKPPAPEQTEPAQPSVVAGEASPMQNPSAPERRSAPATPTTVESVREETGGETALSDASLVASAQAAAAVRDAPHTQRHSLAPLAHAHRFDPSTGLLSSAGLQHAIISAFEVPRRAGHVTMLMFTIRDLDRIEQAHGRLASAAVTREVADRIRTVLPQGTGARFARSAYAVVFVGDLSNVIETTQWLARVLLQLRAPVEGGSLGDKIDVVAGMAQCYESEDAAQFVKRANLGLARAVQLPEPTLVAMP